MLIIVVISISDLRLSAAIITLVVIQHIFIYDHLTAPSGPPPSSPEQNTKDKSDHSKDEGTSNSRTNVDDIKL